MSDSRAGRALWQLDGMFPALPNGAHTAALSRADCQLPTGQTTAHQMWVLYNLISYSVVFRFSWWPLVRKAKFSWISQVPIRNPTQVSLLTCTIHFHKAILPHATVVRIPRYELKTQWRQTHSCVQYIIDNSIMYCTLHIEMCRGIHFKLVDCQNLIIINP